MCCKMTQIPTCYMNHGLAEFVLDFSCVVENDFKGLQVVFMHQRIDDKGQVSRS